MQRLRQSISGGIIAFKHAVLALLGALKTAESRKVLWADFKSGRWLTCVLDDKVGRRTLAFCAVVLTFCIVLALWDPFARFASEYLSAEWVVDFLSIPDWTMAVFAVCLLLLLWFWFRLSRLEGALRTVPLEIVFDPTDPRCNVLVQDGEQARRQFRILVGNTKSKKMITRCKAKFELIQPLYRDPSEYSEYRDPMELTWLKGADVIEVDFAIGEQIPLNVITMIGSDMLIEQEGAASGAKPPAFRPPIGRIDAPSAPGHYRMQVSIFSAETNPTTVEFRFNYTGEAETSEFAVMRIYEKEWPLIP